MRNKKFAAAVGSATLLAVLSANVYASGFQVFETDASGLGNSYAGGAAIADDAATEFNNPAGMVRLKSPELDLGGVIVVAHGMFHNDKATPTAAHSGTSNVNFLGPDYLPSLHFATPILPRTFFGFGITVPYGYHTDYGKDSIASSFATKSQIMALNFNPNLAFQITDQLSAGVGFDAQYLDATLDRYKKIDMADSHTSANDWAYGWNAGLLYQFTEATRLGFSYRSQVVHKPTGNSSLEVLGASTAVPTPPNGYYTWDVATRLTTPETLMLSAYHDINTSLAAMATVTWTHWSKFKDLPITYSNPSGPVPISLGTVTTSENFHNTYRAALGVNYHLNDNATLKFGTAYDQSPVDDNNRTIQLPDSDRVWASFGGQYDFNKYVSANLGYAHLFIRNGKLNFTDPAPGPTSTITAHYNHNYANLLGAQVNLRF